MRLTIHYVVDCLFSHNKPLATIGPSCHNSSMNIEYTVLVDHLDSRAIAWYLECFGIVKASVARYTYSTLSRYGVSVNSALK